MNTTNIGKHLSLLGLEAEDKVTKFKGTVTTISFDLYGCIQAVLSPQMKKDGTIPEGRWFDVNRLKVLGEKPVMDRPNFEEGHQAEGNQGCAEKPLRGS